MSIVKRRWECILRVYIAIVIIFLGVHYFWKLGWDPYRIIAAVAITGFLVFVAAEVIEWIIRKILKRK